MLGGILLIQVFLQRRGVADSTSFQKVGAHKFSRLRVAELGGVARVIGQQHDRWRCDFNPRWKFPAKEASMTQKSLWRGVLIVVLSVVLATQGLADQPRLAPTSIGPSKAASAAILIGIGVAAVAVVVVVAILVTHHKPQTITGCVSSGANGMSVTDEKDKRNYALSGNTAGAKPGDRMTLEGKRKHAGKALVFEAHTVAADFGRCQP